MAGSADVVSTGGTCICSAEGYHCGFSGNAEGFVVTETKSARQNLTEQW
jgi:hypothetical protein